MTWTSSKGYLAGNAYPRTLTRIALSVGILALFLVLGSWILLSNPVGSTVSGYLYSVDSSEKLDLSVSASNQTTKSTHEYNAVKNVSSESYVQHSPGALEIKEVKDQVILPVSSNGSSVDENDKLIDKSLSHESSSQLPLSSKDASSTPSDVEKIKDLSAPVPESSTVLTHHDGVKDIVTSSTNVTGNDQTGNSISKEFVNKSNFLDMGINETTPTSPGSNSGAAPAFSHDSNLPNNASRTDSGIVCGFGAFEINSSASLIFLV